MIRKFKRLKDYMRDAEREYFAAVINATNDYGEAAKVLNISQATFYRRVKLHGGFPHTPITLEAAHEIASFVE